MHSWILALALMHAAPSGQGPSVVLFVEQGRALPRTQGQALATRVAALLEKEDLSLVVPTAQVASRLEAVGELPVASCRGQRSCLARLGRTLGAALVVRLEAEVLADTLGLHLEAVSTPGGELVLETAFVVGPDGTQALEGEVTRFARRVRALRAPREPGEPVRDAPLAARVPLPVVVPLPVLTLSPALSGSAPASRKTPASRTLACVTGGGALVSAGAASSFALLGLRAKTRLEDARLPRSEAERLAGRANLSFTLALSSAVLSAALGTVAALTWEVHHERHE